MGKAIQEQSFIQEIGRKRTGRIINTNSKTKAGEDYVDNMFIGFIVFP